MSEMEVFELRKQLATLEQENEAYKKAHEELLKERRAAHHVWCNYSHGPLGGPGCICVVTYRKHIQELEEKVTTLEKDNADLVKFKAWSVDRNNELVERCRYAEKEAREAKGNLAELEKYLEDLDKERH